MNWNLLGTGYPSVPKNFFMAGTRFPSVPKHFFMAGTRCPSVPKFSDRPLYSIKNHISSGSIQLKLSSKWSVRQKQKLEFKISSHFSWSFKIYVSKELYIIKWRFWRQIFEKMKVPDLRWPPVSSKLFSNVLTVSKKHLIQVLEP